jgi:transcriptional regulator GlxA family with amidase domain
MQSIFDLSAMTQWLTDKLISIMTGASTRLSGKGHASRRLLAIEQTDRRILSNPTDPPAVREICTIAGVSERTLEYAFSDCYNMKPKAYINALRLNAVRKQLRAMAPDSILVADAANAWGFWHMGQFAGDYRKLFGENPSETLGCTAKSCRPTCTFREACNACG